MGLGDTTVCDNARYCLDYNLCATRREPHFTYQGPTKTHVLDHRLVLSVWLLDRILIINIVSGKIKTMSFNLISSLSVLIYGSNCVFDEEEEVPLK